MDRFLFLGCCHHENISGGYFMDTQIGIMYEIVSKKSGGVEPKFLKFFKPVTFPDIEKSKEIAIVWLNEMYSIAQSNSERPF